MTKGKVMIPLRFVPAVEGTAGPSTPLRSGRDDTSVWNGYKNEGKAVFISLERRPFPRE